MILKCISKISRKVNAPLEFELMTCCCRSVAYVYLWRYTVSHQDCEKKIYDALVNFIVYFEIKFVFHWRCPILP